MATHYRLGLPELTHGDIWEVAVVKTHRIRPPDEKRHLVLIVQPDKELGWDEHEHPYWRSHLYLGDLSKIDRQEIMANLYALRWMKPNQLNFSKHLTYTYNKPIYWIKKIRNLY